MQVSVESVGSLGRRMKIAVPADQFEKAFVDRLQRFSRSVKMPGFRPGKVPLKMVEAQYGPQLMEEVAGSLIESSYQEAIGREGLRPAGGPKIHPESLGRGKDLQFTAEFEVIPEVKQLDIAGTKIERPVAIIEDSDVDSTLETIRRQNMSWNEVTRPAQDGDRVLVDFSGRLGGEVFEGGTAKDFPVVIGSNTLLEELEKGLVGAGAGDIRTIAVQFPSDYRHDKLAGKSADFEVQVKTISEPVLPVLDAEFAKRFGVADGDLAKLRADVRGNLEREAAKRTRAIVRARVLNALLAANPVEVPQGLMNAEIARLKGQKSSGSDSAGLEARARARVALWLILAEIIRVRGHRADPASVRAKLQELAQEYEKPAELVQWYYANPERLAEVERLVIEERVIEELLAGAEVVEQAVPLQELLKMESA
jgi:trigger factor